jgi:DNA processing protein
MEEQYLAGLKPGSPKMKSGPERPDQSGNHDAVVRNYLAMMSLPGLGQSTLCWLVAEHGDISKVLELPLQAFGQLPLESRQMLLRYRANPETGVLASLANTTLEWCSSNDTCLLTFEDAGYPALLREIHRPPPVLFAKGELRLLQVPSLAIIGSRNASRQSLHLAELFAGELSGSLSIVSGLALGIDAAAHRGGLEGSCSTIAVMATGVDVCYPRRHRTLYQKICERGLVLSEFRPGTEARREYFPQRNRIISGLAAATLVVEARMNSGTLITAHHALEQGREVMAVPGNPAFENHRGCHSLIRQGAALIESTKDVYEVMGMEPVQVSNPTGQGAPASKQELVLLECMEQGPVNIDSLAQQTGFSLPDINQALLRLELEGMVALDGAGYVRVNTRGGSG